MSDKSNDVGNPPVQPLVVSEQLRTPVDRQLAIAETTRAATLIAKDVLEIVKINAESRAETDRIHAETAQIAARIREETQRLRQVGDNITKKGNAAVALIASLSQVLSAMPDSDAATRERAIDLVAQLGLAVLRE
jgi:uncharacterized coiled-coil DUF342 family protein